MRATIFFLLLTVSSFLCFESLAQDSAALSIPSKEVFLMVNQMPSFPGGNQKMLEYLAKNIRYPDKAVELGIEGKVIVSFIVNEMGKVEEAQVVKKLDPSLDKEALRVVNNMPNWTVGRQNGKPVRVRMNLPVTFRLD